MTLPAARLTDMHVCPMQTPAVPPIPHVGGPTTGPEPRLFDRKYASSYTWGCRCMRTAGFNLRKRYRIN